MIYKPAAAFVKICMAIISGIVMFGCKGKQTLFTLLPASQTGIDYNNKVVETDSINPLDMEYLYNGGGVAIGDFNKDGLPDIYFTSSQTKNALYLNKGKMHFQDVTTQAGVDGQGRWCNGASVVDINNDGWPDIYVCASIKSKGRDRQNLFYINQGTNAEGIPVFKEMAAAYNLADTGFSVQAVFFDYDHDGDLDMYLVRTQLARRNAARFDGNGETNNAELSDKLFRNEGSDSLGHPFFKDVSKQAGIGDQGYGLSVVVDDFNRDGWPDLYVSDDFFSSDLLYINNRDGSFSERVRSSMGHTSQNSMGVDAADINNDGLPDICVVDMNPEDNLRKKTNMAGNNYYMSRVLTANGLMLQYVRNTLQLHQGIIPDTGKSKTIPVFGDISFYAGVAETDWSWNPSLVDFDNDGYRDLFITNGYPRDVTDHDFAVYRRNAVATIPKADLLSQIPKVKIANYAFRNTNGLHFENVTNTWGLATPSFSNGAAYVDLDLDGDLDYVVNNINDEAFIYQNNERQQDHHHYIDLRFDGAAQNKNGIGATVRLFYDHQQQYGYNSPVRGYLSSTDASLHFGLGTDSTIDSLIVQWPDGKKQSIRNPSIDKILLLHYADARFDSIHTYQSAPLLEPLALSNTLAFRHQESDFIDFDIQKLLPHKLSQFGPGIAIADVDGDGLDDVFLGASAGFDGSFFLQQQNRKFIRRDLPPPAGRDVRLPEMTGLLLFDADGDGDNDLYMAAGSDEFAPNTKNYADRLYLNDGKGNFTYDSSAIPDIRTSKSCVRAVDYDHDGDLDLFIGGRMIPQRYPAPASCIILRNDSKNGKTKFTDVTATVAPSLQNIGLVCDAIWSDFNNDGWPDLILAGEWMPIQFLENKKGSFVNITSQTGIQQYSGWWNSIVAVDVNNDGRMDYVAGNLGLNSFYKADSAHPLRMYGGDFDGDGNYDAIPSVYLPDQDGSLKEFPANGREDMIKQMAGFRKRYPTYKLFGAATMQDIMVPFKKDGSVTVSANTMASCVFINTGNGKFVARQLPPAGQLAPVFGIKAADINEDGFQDLILVGNDFSAEPANGRYDAMKGLVLLGKGDGDFQSLTVEQSGFYSPGDAKALAEISLADGKIGFAVTRNRDSLLLFTSKNKTPLLHFSPHDVYAEVHLKNGGMYKEELFFGDGFLAQSSRCLRWTSAMKEIIIVDDKNAKRSWIAAQ